MAKIKATLPASREGYLTCAIMGKRVKPSPELMAATYEGELWGSSPDSEGINTIKVKGYATKENQPLSDLIWKHREPGVSASHMVRGPVYWQWTLRETDFAWIKMKPRSKSLTSPPTLKRGA